MASLCFDGEDVESVTLCYCSGVVYAFAQTSREVNLSSGYHSSDDEYETKYQVEIHALNLALEGEATPFWQAVHVPRVIADTSGVVCAWEDEPGEMVCVVDLAPSYECEQRVCYGCATIRLVPSFQRIQSLRGESVVEDITFSVSMAKQQHHAITGDCYHRHRDSGCPDYIVGLSNGLLAGTDVVSGDLVPLRRVRGPLEFIGSDGPGRSRYTQRDCVCSMADGRVMCYDSVLKRVYLVDLYQ
ncbi:hypothetical protein KIPB_007659 [Kipferlia bialata]|uniref:Uncharacterized protein n=1 Tax=Kipferlia bialata TaxID=797122 RepID=A0A391NN43_9EUKA|nr:hypothetical protein KIPB_007659 [Kipferlia bialata]|eukprot:g7659.t1